MTWVGCLVFGGICNLGGFSLINEERTWLRLRKDMKRLGESISIDNIECDGKQLDCFRIVKIRIAITIQIEKEIIDLFLKY